MVNPTRPDPNDDRPDPNLFVCFVFVNVYNKPINNMSMEDKMESCDKCGTVVYERNLAMFGHKFICPSCQGLSDEELNAYWTEQEQDELHIANGGA